MTTIPYFMQWLEKTNMKKLRFARCFIKKAPDCGRNPGWWYVKSVEGAFYLGKISPDGVLWPAFSTEVKPFYIDDLLKALTAKSPDELKEFFAESGRASGVCCVCGRCLTDPESIAAGIGPICAARF